MCDFMFFRFGVRLASGLLLFVTSAAARAGDADTAIAKLLDVGWSVSPQARTAADLQYQEILKVAPDDARASEASWLVLMVQRRFDAALKRLDEHLVRWPSDLSALRAKTWIQTVLKNYSAAVVSADRLSTLLTADGPMTDAERAEHAELIGFLGRLVGYLGGPVAEAFNQDERKQLEKRWLGRLADSQRTLFEDARNGVLARFIAMTDESSDARDKAAATAQAEKEKTLAELNTDREQMAARAKELEERRNKLRSELQSEMDTINKQDQPLVQQAAQLASQANVLNIDLLNYQSQIAALEQLAAQEKDPVRRQQLLSQVNALVLIASRLNADLLNVNRLQRGVQNQRAALQVRRNQAQSNAASQTDRLDRELTDLARRDRRNEGLEKRATRPVSASSSKSRSLSAQATALSTYDAFPLEAAKARLLESLK